MNLRPYQEQAVAAVLSKWETARRLLLVLPTGTGKTIVFAKLAEQMVMSGRRVLILAHRDELIRQAADKLIQATGMSCAVEKADETALDSLEYITVGSVQTLMRSNRLERFPRDHYDVIVVDETHHILSPSYQRILDYWDQAHVLGVTATPDRGDKKNLGQFFEELAFEYSIRQAIKDKWLCSIVAKTIPLNIDIAGVKTSQGDYDPKELGTALDPYLEQIAGHLKTTIGRRQTLVFLPLIKTSEKFCGILQGIGLNARHVSGVSEDRKELLRDFAANKFQILCNSMLLTEGYDCPQIACVVCLRPTKIRSLYAQIIGRGTRPAEFKENLLILDFLWHTSKHDLCHPAHLIAEKPEVADAMTEIQDEAAKGDEPIDLETLDKAGESRAMKQREEALAKELRAQRNKKGKVLDPVWYAVSINADDLNDYEPSSLNELQPPTNPQLDLLAKWGFGDKSIPNRGYASKLIDRLIARSKANMATPRQVRILAQYGRSAGTLTFDEARACIDKIAKNGWRPVYD